MTKITARTRANERLTFALVRLASDGRRPPCGLDTAFSGYWTSEDPREQQQAARWCQGCPIAAECQEAGRGEPHGVWAGRIHQPRTKRSLPEDIPSNQET